jgi:hypothetical protein
MEDSQQEEMCSFKTGKIMLLYHGTNEDVALKVLKEGLRPRALTKSKGNWQHSINSYNCVCSIFCFDGFKRKAKVVDHRN